MMATARRRLAAPISDSKKLDICSSAVPSKRKACIEWGIKVWSDWSSGKIVASIDIASRVSPMTSLLEMSVDDFAYWLRKFVIEVCKTGVSIHME